MERLSRCDVLRMHTDSERKTLRSKILRNAPSGKGIYVLYEGPTPMYVGRSDDLASRLLAHGRRSGSSENSSFAFNLAREKYPDADEVTRGELEQVDEFKALFTEAKERVKRMDVRVVEVIDPIEQTILEVYAHLELSTINSFENH
jgi:hypothetical protein